MTSDAFDIEEILSKTDKVLGESVDLEQKLQAVCALLQEQVPHYDWVGFYLVQGDEELLELGPFVGAATEHTLIPFGKGVCGQVAESRETTVIQDVTAEDNYLACSLDVQSEIVAPILKDGRFLGELDIDSHAPSPFRDADTRLLEEICQRLARHF